MKKKLLATALSATLLISAFSPIAASAISKTNCSFTKNNSSCPINLSTAYDKSCVANTVTYKYSIPQMVNYIYDDNNASTTDCEDASFNLYDYFFKELSLCLNNNSDEKQADDEECNEQPIKEKYKKSVDDKVKIKDKVNSKDKKDKIVIDDKKDSKSKDDKVVIDDTVNSKDKNNKTVDENVTKKDKDTDTVKDSAKEFEAEVVRLVNIERKKAGLDPLKENDELSKVARVKSQEMKNKGYFSHTSPAYGSPFDMMKQFGIKYVAAGENIAKGQKSPESVVNAWMNSDGHRRNILNANFTEIGVGYTVDNNGTTYWTQMFINPGY